MLNAKFGFLKGERTLLEYTHRVFKIYTEGKYKRMSSGSYFNIANCARLKNFVGNRKLKKERLV